VRTGRITGWRDRASPAVPRGLWRARHFGQSPCAAYSRRRG